MLLSFGLHVIVIYFHASQVYGTASDSINLDEYVSFLTDDAAGCTSSDGEISEPAIVKIPLEGTKKFKFDIPSTWQAEKYECQWNVVLEDQSESAANDAVGLKFKFFSFEFMEYWNRTGGIAGRGLGIQIKVPRVEFETFVGLQSDERMTKYHVTPNNIQLTFEKRSRRKDEPFYIDISAVEPHNFPKRYKVEEIVASKDRIIRDHNFSWQDGRMFCKRQSPGMDLCNSETPYVCDGYMTFSHTKTDYDQYFPMLPYNAWGRIDSGSWCVGLPRNPIWGMDKTKCPRFGGCRSKTYIFCCQHESPVRVDKTSGTMTTYVTSGRSPTGEYDYRFSDKSNSEEFLDGSDEGTGWNDYFKVAGRIPGDVDRFELYNGYTPRVSTVVYFCQNRTLNEDNPANFRYKISLKPCDDPWYQVNYGYGSRTPRSGMKRIYFGQSREGDGTRVSLTPPCCGYDDPEESFMLYGIVKRAWGAKLSSRFCPKSHWFGTPSATISSNLLGPDYTVPVVCSWKIKVPSGRGIKIEYKYESFERSRIPILCGQDYLEFSNLLTKRSYGRVCKSGTGNFVSDSNMVDINFVLEDSMAKFSINYTEVPEVNPAPIKFALNNESETWFEARVVCTGNDLNLCSKHDICPTGNYPYQGARADWAWVAVGDAVNQWVQLGTGNKFKICEAHTATQPPSDWVKQDENFVYCCDRPGMESPVSRPVRVNIGHHKRLGVYYWFNRAEEWESPAYRFNYYDPYHAEGDELEIVHPWKPPSTFTDAPTNVVDFFKMSSEYEEGYFEQIVIFCRRSEHFGFNVATPFTTVYQLSLNNCDDIWEYDFHLYAGKVKSEKTPVELHVGKSDVTTGSVCCHTNPESFTLYVISAEIVDSYEVPEVDVDFDY